VTALEGATREFLAEGTAIKDLLSLDRVIIRSVDTASSRRAAASRCICSVGAVVKNYYY
jgi:UDP-glucose 6-dehydrogenase